MILCTILAFSWIGIPIVLEAMIIIHVGKDLTVGVEKSQLSHKSSFCLIGYRSESK